MATVTKGTHDCTEKKRFEQPTHYRANRKCNAYAIPSKTPFIQVFNFDVVESILVSILSLAGSWLSLSSHSSRLFATRDSQERRFLAWCKDELHPASVHSAVIYVSIVSYSRRRIQISALRPSLAVCHCANIVRFELFWSQSSCKDMAQPFIVRGTCSATLICLFPVLRPLRASGKSIMRLRFSYNDSDTGGVYSSTRVELSFAFFALP